MAKVLHGLRARGGFNVEVKLVGNWLKFNQLVGTLDATTMLAAVTAQRKFAEKYRDRVKINIRTGGKRFGYPSHSPDYKKYKAKHGGGTRLLHWSGSFEEAVEVVGLSGGRVGVGVPKDAVRERYEGEKRELLTISEYANILERGSVSRSIPKRPVFTDTFKKDMKGLKGLRSYIQWHIVRNFGLQGIQVIKI